MSIACSAECLEIAESAEWARVKLYKHVLLTEDICSASFLQDAGPVKGSRLLATALHADGHFGAMLLLSAETLRANLAIPAKEGFVGGPSDFTIGGAHLESSSGPAKGDFLFENMAVARHVGEFRSCEDGFSLKIGSRMAHNTHGSEVLTWDRGPNCFEKFVTACKWYHNNLKDNERHLDAARVRNKLTGAAKGMVRNLSPEEFCGDGINKLLSVLRESPLQKLPIVTS
ncbi:unnamed protein product [Symbiodinium necroappetens]|uniref:Uncharacterized protein n=1 Tax=Symbiodinium necroappetens TaxID=1628268 RepID=A0A813BCD3_9DINO|nr:unnamed protein product [Symbiodinium necroappetens]